MNEPQVAIYARVSSEQQSEAKTINTPWPPNTDILVRKAINLPAGTTGVAVHMAIDNDAVVYWNGVQIGSTVHENCAARDTLVATAPDSAVIAGSNVLAVRGTDRGGLTYLDVQVTAHSSSLPIPVVQSVSPSYGPMGRGTPITITGSGFTGASAVAISSSFTSQPCYPNPTPSCFTVSTDGTLITLTTPPVNSRSTVDIRVFAADGVTGSTVSPADQFTYLAAGCGVISPTSTLDNFIGQLCLMSSGLTSITAHQDDSLKSILASLPSVRRTGPHHWRGPEALFLPASKGEAMKATAKVLSETLKEDVASMVADMTAEKIIDLFPCTVQGYYSLSQARGDAAQSVLDFNKASQTLRSANGQLTDTTMPKFINSMTKANLELIRALLEAADGMHKLSSQCAKELQAKVDSINQDATALDGAVNAARNARQALAHTPTAGWRFFPVLPNANCCGWLIVADLSLFPHGRLKHSDYPFGVPRTDTIDAPLPLPAGGRAR